MVNPFEETAIAGDISLTPHDRVQQERDLRIEEVANMYMNTDVTSPGQEATRYVDWKYPPVFGELTPGSKGHPYEGGWGPEHKWARPTNLGYNPLKYIFDYSINKVKPAIRDVMGFPQPSWVDEYINREVPRGVASLDPTIEVAQSQWRRPENIEKTIDVLEIRPEFEGWSRDEIKAYIFRSTQQANRGGIIGLI